MGRFLLSLHLLLLARPALGGDRPEPRPPTADEVLAYLGFDARAKRDLLSGKIISKDFLWVKQRVEGRPAFILAHRLFYRVGDGALMAERQFYAGHSYNSLQIFVG
ncbi:MAG: hypothetical protein ACRD2T_05515, partial [Thermoanaerobaculia bacterium]